ncbi:hypothetical protein BDV97DRAFT_385589 [Neofusicoccum parvum]|nr:hypothetical protein BDV97DRAFT_385589 [Neofusicoccum parvum]
MFGFEKVIIVGAGPTGALLALLLARKGIQVEMLDQAHGPDKQPRASHYSTPALPELRRAGVLDDVYTAGFIPGKMSWRKLDGTRIAGLDSSVMDKSDRIVCLPLDKLGDILFKHLGQQKSAVVKWGCKVVALGQDETKGWVDVETDGKKKRLDADYIIGCDGANSQVRKCLFGDKSFPGMTWDEQLVATNVYYDLGKWGFDDVNYIIHPEHWFMAARITTDGMWRVTYGETPGLSPEELISRQPPKFKEMLPGSPEPRDYKITNISPYRVHQRLAEEMRVGRVLLAGDAAHLNNPFGGLGLTGGIVDVGGLYDCLMGIHEGKADSSILDVYSDVRREKYYTIVNPTSSANFRRLFDQDPDTALDGDEFLKICRRAESDPRLSREFQLNINALRYDFTQHYHSKP